MNTMNKQILFLFITVSCSLKAAERSVLMLTCDESNRLDELHLFLRDEIDSKNTYAIGIADALKENVSVDLHNRRIGLSSRFHAKLGRQKGAAAQAKLAVAKAFGKAQSVPDEKLVEFACEKLSESDLRLLLERSYLEKWLSVLWNPEVYDKILFEYERKRSVRELAELEFYPDPTSGAKIKET